MVLEIGGADQRELALVRDRKDDAAIDVLENVRERVVEQARHDDMAALDQPHRAARANRRGLIEERTDPRAGRVDDAAGADVVAVAVLGQQRCRPRTVLAHDARATRVGQDPRAALARIERVQHHQARVVDPAVGIDEALAVGATQRHAGRVRAQVDGFRAWQTPPPGQVVVQEQSRANHPRRSQVRLVRQHETQRPHDVRGGVEQHLPFGQRLLDQAKLVVLEVAQSAVDKFRARRGGVRGEIVLLTQHHPEAVTRGIACDARAVDAAADDQQIALLHAGAHPAARDRVAMRVRDARCSIGAVAQVRSWSGRSRVGKLRPAAPGSVEPLL